MDKGIRAIHLNKNFAIHLPEIRLNTFSSVVWIRKGLGKEDKNLGKVSTELDKCLIFILYNGNSNMTFNMVKKVN